MKRPLTKIAAGVALLLFLAIGLYGTWFLASNAPVKVVPRTFSASEWHTADSLLRGQMVNDLISSRVLVGKSRSEVTELLGPANNDWDLVWNYSQIDVGQRFFGRPWYYHMRVRFNQNGIVEEADLLD
jgi:hypothetical protein